MSDKYITLSTGITRSTFQPTATTSPATKAEEPSNKSGKPRPMPMPKDNPSSYPDPDEPM